MHAAVQDRLAKLVKKEHACAVSAASQPRHVGACPAASGRSSNAHNVRFANAIVLLQSIAAVPSGSWQ